MAINVNVDVNANGGVSGKNRQIQIEKTEFKLNGKVDGRLSTAFSIESKVDSDKLEIKSKGNKVGARFF